MSKTTAIAPAHPMPLLIGVLLFQQLLGALCFPISKFGLAYIEPFTFAFYRFGLSSIVLLILTFSKRESTPIKRRDWYKIIGLGFLIIPLNQTLYLWGQSLTGAGHGSLLFATAPIWIFLAALFHLSEKSSPRRVAGIVVGILGVIIVVSSGALKLGEEYLFGDLLILLAVIAWAYYTVYGKKLVQKYGAMRVTAYALVSGSLMYFPFGLYAALRFEYHDIPLSAWMSVLYMAIGTSVIAYVLWYWVLKYLEASRIAVFHNLQPLLAASLAWAWLGEPLTTGFIVGSIVTLLGVIISEV